MNKTLKTILLATGSLIAAGGLVYGGLYLKDYLEAKNAAAAEAARQAQIRAQHMAAVIAAGQATDALGNATNYNGYNGPKKPCCS